MDACFLQRKRLLNSLNSPNLVTVMVMGKENPDGDKIVQMRKIVGTTPPLLQNKKSTAASILILSFPCSVPVPPSPLKSTKRHGRLPAEEAFMIERGG